MPKVQERVVEHARLAPGLEVNWRHSTNKGYGASWLVPARVVSVGPRRVQIAARMKDGSEKLVWVMAKSLREKA